MRVEEAQGMLNTAKTGLAGDVFRVAGLRGLWVKVRNERAAKDADIEFISLDMGSKAEIDQGTMCILVKGGFVEDSRFD